MTNRQTLALARKVLRETKQYPDDDAACVFCREAVSTECDLEATNPAICHPCAQEQLVKLAQGVVRLALAGDAQ